MLLVILGFGLALRTWKLDKPIMWVDEAESGINALTILQHGVPTSEYLGLPIYENTLTDPWPESQEYEFRDSSYSKKGVAIYHGWFPLYSMAASFKAFGIEPDTDTTRLVAGHDLAAISKRSWVPRIPSVICGMIFLVLLFMAGTEMYGRDAGWAAMATAAVAVPMVNIARQARYYSATAMLSAACCLMGWRMFKRGRWQDFIIGGFVFALMFHTHVLTFAIACVSVATLVPWMFRHEKAIYKMLVCGTIIAAATIPWMIGTGFIGSAQSVPKAIYSMKFPQDLLAWPHKYWQISLLMVGGMLFVSLLQLRPQWFAQRIRDAYDAHRPALLFLSIWIIAGFVLFMVLIPAASLFFQRLYLGAVGPGIIFGAALFAGLGRMIGRRAGQTIAIVAFIAFVLVNTKAGYWWQRNKEGPRNISTVLEDMSHWKLKPGTRVYSIPNDHLTLTYYSGIPVQSISPVRKSFLDNYPGDIVLVMTWIPVWPMHWEHIREAAANFGVTLTEQEVAEWTDTVNRVGAARKIAPTVSSTIPDTKPLPPFAESIFPVQAEKTEKWNHSFDFNYMNPAMFRGYNFPDQFTMWQTFFYRFVDPEKRLGANRNYTDRMKRAEARVLPTMWTIYTSPGIDTKQASQAMESK